MFSGERILIRFLNVLKLLRKRREQEKADCHIIGAFGFYFYGFVGIAYQLCTIYY